MGAMWYNKERHKHNNNYFPLLIFLSLAIFSPAWFDLLPTNEPWLLPWVLPSLLTLAVISGIWACTDNFKQLLLGLLLGITALVFEWMRPFIDDTELIARLRVWSWFILYGYLLLRIINHIFSLSKVNNRLIAAAIAGFLAMGLMGAMLVNFLMQRDPFAFDGMHADTSFQTYDIIYYTFITLTSVGYGDITPRSDGAQALSVFLGIIGQAYFAIIIAIIVGKYLMSRRTDII